MKPDGVSTTPPEPTEALGAAAVAEDVANEEQPQEDQDQSPPQPEELENAQILADSTAPPPEKKANGKTSGPKNATKAPVKTKLGTTAPKTLSAVTRPAPAQTRVANGVSRPSTNCTAKKPANAPAATAVKKPISTGAAAQAKKGPTAATAAPRTQMKVAERKPVGTTRPAVSSMSSGSKPVAAANAATALNKKPAAAANNAAAKSKTTAPRPATAPASKPAASKAAPVPKTRPATAAASHTTTSTTSVRPTTTTTKPAASRTASAPSTARSASLQSSKTTTTTVAAGKKDAGQTSTKAPVRKPTATKTTTSALSASAKPSKPEPPKLATAAKRPPVDTKTTRPKTDDSKPVPTRKVPPSPRNTSSKLTSSNNMKQAGSSTPVAVKRQTTKPTQSVSPMVIKGKPSEKEQAKEPVEPSAPVATVSPTTDITVAASVSEVEANSVLQLEEQLNQETSVPVEVQDNEVAQFPSSEPSDVENVPVVEQVNVESLAVQLEAEAPIVESEPPSVPAVHESNNDYISVETPAVQEETQQEPLSTPPLEVSVAATVIPKGVEVVEKAEQIIHNDVEEEEEEREGSQQVSISDMSGTQPTEESRPGSAGLAGSVWRAGGLLSELDSEDVSCSQQGASELSAPGVLEGTESMDDLGEASLKGADGEGASAGSPDFEKVPDIPVNEDDNEDDEDDEDDRVCDMDVGSERAEDSHRPCHDDEDEDDDVEMASEGITESGLESYGNADEDDFAEDYRLDNLNRMQPHPIVPSAPPAAQWDQTNPFADPWIQPRQQDSTFPSSPSSSPRQANLETLAQASHQALLDHEHAKGGPISHVQPLMEPVPSSPQLAPVPSAEKDVRFSPDLGSFTQGMSGPNAASGLEQDAHSCSDTSTPEEQKDYNIISGVDNLQQQVAVPVSSVPAVLPDIMQDLGIQLEHGDEEEEPETLPADDVLGGPATAPTSVPSSPSSATEDEASDTEGEMQISEPSVEPVATGNECFGSVQVAHSLSTLEEREEASAEAEGGGGSDTPQSATSAASYGFDCTTTSNSNAQSTTESCAKSPGIFSLENEDQLPDEAKDPSLIKELILTPACAPGDVDKLHAEQQEIVPPNLEQQYMHCVKAGEELPGPCSPSGTEPTEGGLVNPSSQHQDGVWDLDAQHPYYSTICEKTDGSLAGMNIRSLHQPHEVLTIHMTMSPKRRPRPPVDHVTNPPRLPTDLPPRIPSMGPNAQLQRLERHQQQLMQIEQRREKQNQLSENREQQGEREQNGDDRKCDEHQNEKRTQKQAEDELEEKKKREVKEKELEDQRRDLLQLQIQQQQQELKQRQQIMQWQQELEQQNKHQNKQSKTNVTNVLLSPSGLCTIYEALETSDAEDDLKDKNEEKEMLTEEKTGCEESQHLCSKPKRASSPPKGNTAFPQAHSTCSLELIQDQEVGLTHPAAPDSPLLTCSEQPSPLELDWGKKVDIVQQLINQTLLLAGDSCSPLYLLPGGSAGTLSPLETSLWPNLLPSLAQPSATVTSVSSFSPEASGSSPQGEWTVVELETHH